jgi:hypothetical protein
MRRQTPFGAADDDAGQQDHVAAAGTQLRP